MKLLLVTILISMAFTGVSDEVVLNELDPLAQKLSLITGFHKESVLNEVFGEIQFRFERSEQINYSCWSSLVCYGRPPFEGLAEGLLVHELGHRFLNDLSLTFDDIGLSIGYYQDDRYVHVSGFNPITWRYERTPAGYPHPGQPYEQHGSLSPNYNTYREDFADMFMNWALDRFENDLAGRARYAWMNRFIKVHIVYKQVFREIIR